MTKQYRPTIFYPSIKITTEWKNITVDYFNHPFYNKDIYTWLEQAIDGYWYSLDVMGVV